ncbi:division/cell wall cluster transcriptional repressor MraZ [soil metagenome]
MFLGEFIHTLDDKGRVVMPSSFRAALKEGLVTAKGKDGNIVVLPASTFDELAREELEQPRTREARRQARAMFSSAEFMKLDSQGRILLKPSLRTYAGLVDADEVTVAGLYDRIEIWEVDSFVRERQEADVEYRSNEEVPGF